MNLGFSGTIQFKPESTDELEAHHISLYIKLLNKIPDISTGNKNRSVLEIGCGRGGGCYVMQRYFGLQNISGIDKSPSNIKLASTLVKGVDFVVRNANDFEIKKKYDLIVNLESSHAYASRLDFFKKVASALQPGSHFAFGDLILKINLEKVESMMTECGLKIIETETINEQVIKSITENSPRQYPLLTSFPYLFPKVLHNFSVSIHSKSFKSLQQGEFLYQLYLLQKI